MHAADTYADLRSKLRIDELRLSDELMEQPFLVQQCAEHAAEAIQIRDAAKFDLDIATADVARLMRGTPDESGKVPSESAILSRLPLHTSVQKANGALDDAKRDAAIWTALVDSMRDKGSALRRAAEMLLAGFLAPNAAHQTRRQEIRQASAAVTASDEPSPRFRRRG